MTTIALNQTEIAFSEETLLFSIKKDDIEWSWDSSYRPKAETVYGTIYFSEAKEITHNEWISGLGKGIISHYEGFTVEGKEIDFAFETIVWIEAVSGSVFCEFIPLHDKKLQIKEVFWPGYMSFTQSAEDWYTLLNIQQGLLIPNTWETELEKLLFDGMLDTAGAYMPWFGQVKPKGGYIAICEQPSDASYYAEHPAKGPYTHVGFKWRPSLGKMSYRRTVRYTFLNCCDYNDLCKVYRNYTKEKGSFTSLAEKGAKAPVEKLIGAAFIHKGIKTQVMEDSDFFDPNMPEKNNKIISFQTRTEEIRKYQELGLEKMYLHLDGWAQPGYDNQHPDYLPACEAAGGWQGMKQLADTIHECGYAFGIHDQYRDYYFAAKTFDSNFAIQLADGTMPEHKRWAGGHQTLLCATQAPMYVKRNFSEIKENGVKLDCAYLDVFTCNEGDECDHPQHRMTRQECLDYRAQCFAYLLSQGILPSSEEVTDWSMKSLVFAHYAPYEFMMEKPGTPAKGIPVPLFNLVYHDCLIIPWMMEKMVDGDDLMLYALLNGGVPYFIREGAYQNTDGSFDAYYTKMNDGELAERCKIVMELHKKIAKAEMLSHEFVDRDYKIEKTVFSNGIAVTVNFHTQTYQIEQE